MCDPEFGLEHVGRWPIRKRKRRKSQQTTVGWKLLVAWKVGSETWVSLKDLKESNPVEVAEVSRARGIDDETIFVWWAPCTPKKRDAIIAKVKGHVRKGKTWSLKKLSQKTCNIFFIKALKYVISFRSRV